MPCLLYPTVCIIDILALHRCLPRHGTQLRLQNRKPGEQTNSHNTRGTLSMLS
jgi:hypothetical protein